MTNYHKLGGLSQQNFVYSYEVQNYGVSMAAFFLKALGKNFCLPLLAFRSCLQLLLCFSI